MNQKSERTIFLDAVELDDLNERQLYLDQSCGNDSKLRAGVEALLDASDQPDNLLDLPPVAITTDSSPMLRGEMTHEALIGRMVGRYRLMELIGEGGFGLVFVAQQDQPVRRQVALKIVKPGTGSKEIIARFEAERQAVAMMDHPNIARVFDAGVSEDGWPFFVMELVRGVPITEFADAHQMTIQQRLRLFRDVCAAVHHAHQKGVIHRDIKPSNVMVTLHDDQPVVKVIDFGVAKAIGQVLTEKTIYTRFFSMIGTPLYMSPEQAEMSGLDVDTRSDIYSLGVMLYELLSGETPFDRARLDSAGLDEMRRIIREEQPPRPSKRSSTLGPRMLTVASSRRIAPNHVESSLAGDLDWIVMKAIEKDRKRRYDSAAAMAADIDRYSEQQPIVARPPSLSYQLIKFAKRNRVALATGAVVLMTMILGTATSIWQMNRAISERDQKELALQEIEQFSTKVTQAHLLIASAETHADSQQWMLAKNDFDAAVTQQPSYYLPFVSRAQFFMRTDLWDAAAQDFAKAIQLGAPTDTPQWWGTAALFAWSHQDEALGNLTDQLQQQLDLKQELRSWEQIRSGLATDDGLSNEAFQRLAEIAEEWLEGVNIARGNDRPPGFGPPGPNQRGSNQPGPTGNIPGLPLPVCQYVTGLAHLRSGEIEKAIARLEQCNLDDRWPARGLVHAPLALAYHANGQHDEASEALAKSTEAAEQAAEDLYRESVAEDSEYEDLGFVAPVFDGPGNGPPENGGPDDGRPGSERPQFGGPQFGGPGFGGPGFGGTGFGGPGSRRSMPWFDFIELLQLRQEAALMLTGSMPDSPPKLDQLHQRSLKRFER